MRGNREYRNFAERRGHRENRDFAERRDDREHRNFAECGRHRENRNNGCRDLRAETTCGRGEICMELTGEGRRFCAVAAFAEEAIALWALGIQVSTSPAPVLVFMWVLFAILTAAALISAGWLRERIEECCMAAGLRRARISVVSGTRLKADGRPGACPVGQSAA